ncbi:MAG: cysteine hydrolase [Rhodospirillales bacterium]|nr:cysteine hydrolase [Rhodospirillales bacterium]
MPKADTAVLAIHYQNENCHPDGKIRVGIAADADWRWERLGNAKRLLDGARAAGAAIIHIRLAVPLDYRGVSANTDLIREWMALGAWQEDTWGTAFIQSLEPHASDFVITHTRNSAFYNTTLDEILFQLGVRSLVCAGVSTAYAVEGTVRHATDIGYEVTVAADACSTATHAQHENALAAMKPLASIKTVDEILAELAA